MCDICHRISQQPMIFTSSFLTGEVLYICGDCADNHAEPINTLIHGVNQGALDNLPRDIKDRLTVWTPQGYASIYRLDLHLKLMLPLQAPKKIRMEEQLDAHDITAKAQSLVKSIKAVEETSRRSPPRRDWLQGLRDWFTQPRTVGWATPVELCRR